MQVYDKCVGMVGSTGRTIRVFTPDGADPTNEHGSLSVWFEPGRPNAHLRTNSPFDSSANLIGLDAVKHVHEALGEILRLNGVAPS